MRPYAFTQNVRERKVLFLLLLLWGDYFSRDHPCAVKRDV